MKTEDVQEMVLTAEGHCGQWRLQSRRDRANKRQSTAITHPGGKATTAATAAMSSRDVAHMPRDRATTDLCAEATLPHRCEGGHSIRIDQWGRVFPVSRAHLGCRRPRRCIGSQHVMRRKEHGDSLNQAQ